jgi:Na+/proline symporter
LGFASSSRIGTASLSSLDESLRAANEKHLVVVGRFAGAFSTVIAVLAARLLPGSVLEGANEARTIAAAVHSLAFLIALALAVILSLAFPAAAGGAGYRLPA